MKHTGPSKPEEKLLKESLRLTVIHRLQLGVGAKPPLNLSLNWNVREAIYIMRTYINMPSKTLSYTDLQEPGNASETINRVRDESLIRRHLHNMPRPCQLLSLPVEKYNRRKTKRLACFDCVSPRVCIPDYTTCSPLPCSQGPELR